MEEKETKNKINRVSKSREIALFFTGWIGLQVISIACQFMAIFALAIFKPNINIAEYTKTMQFSMLLNALVYLISFLALIAITNKEFANIFKTNNVLKSVLAGVICFASIIIFNYIYNFIIILTGINMTDNGNETSLDNIIVVYPIMSIIIFGIVGPLVEELTYRVGLFSLASRANKIFAYAVTILVFSLIHFDFDSVVNVCIQGATEENMAVLINELINLPLYAFAAFSFSMTYERHGYVGSATAHILNNLLSISLTILLSRI